MRNIPPPISMLFFFSLFFLLQCKPIEPIHHIIMEDEGEKEKAYQQYPDALYPIRVKDKWGYINRRAEIILPLVWDDASDFEDDRAIVGKMIRGQLLYGYIDRQGNEIIPPSYQRASPFAEELAVVQLEDRYGYIDTSGKVVIPCQYEAAGSFHQGRAAVKINGWTGFIDRTGAVVIEPKFTVSVHHPRFIHGLAPVFGADEMTGYIDTTGQWVIEPRFQSAGNFSQGLAWAMIQEEDASAPHGFTIKGGYIDTSGTYIIAPAYDFGWDFSEGYATVWAIRDDRKSKIWKVIDTNGRIILDTLPYRHVGAYVNGFIPVQDEEMKWGFINLQGEVIIAPQYAGINHFKNGLARMEAGTAFSNTIVYINPEGKVVWKE